MSANHGSYLVEVDSEAGGSEEQHRRHARGPRHQPSCTEGNEGQWGICRVCCDAHLAPHTVPHLGDHHLEQIKKCSDNAWDIKWWFASILLLEQHPCLMRSFPPHCLGSRVDWTFRTQVHRPGIIASFWGQGALLSIIYSQFTDDDDVHYRVLISLMSTTEQWQWVCHPVITLSETLERVSLSPGLISQGLMCSIELVWSGRGNLGLFMITCFLDKHPLLS